MNRTLVVRVVTLTVLLVAFAAIQVSAGGPCMPRMCPQPMCAPPVCPPQMCCPPPCPPPRCQENPLAMICKGAVQIVAGVVALPFRVVGCLTQGICRPACRPVACCPPPMCPPPMCPPPVCGPAYCPPGMGYGMGYGRPVGFGGGAPRRFAPMAQKSKPLPLTLIAGPTGGVFGGYW